MTLYSNNLLDILGVCKFVILLGEFWNSQMDPPYTKCSSDPPGDLLSIHFGLLIFFVYFFSPDGTPPGFLKKLGLGMFLNFITLVLPFL